MQTLFPDIKPYQRHQFAVDPPHVLYLEECGNPDGIPVLFIHGGPGAGYSGKSRCFFDPERYRIILFDQRGSGRSQPHACIENNTTDDLIADIEAIRQFLDIDTWVLFGGSWGATLAIAYAQRRPQQVSAMILRGIFLSRTKELDWLYAEGGASKIFPDYWRDFERQVPRRRDESLVSAYHRAIHDSSNEVASMAAAKAWSLWEARCSTLRPNNQLEHKLLDARTAFAMAHIETHYFMNGGFVDGDALLENMEHISHIPGIIVQGRYDMVCPLETAYELHSRWTNAQLYIIRDAGHSAFEPGISDALVRATDDIANMLSSDELSY